jgi:hypothetical protein
VNGAALVARDLYELHSRVIRMIEALDDCDLDLALALACDLEHDIALASVERAA